MPSVEYTKEKGLVQKSSTSSSLDLRGELSGHRQAVRTLATATEQLSVADSGKELLLGANVRSVLLPAVAGVRTSVKFTAANGPFTVNEVFTFEGFGRKFKLKVVADAADANNGKLVSTDSSGVSTFQLERGLDIDGAITNLHTLLGTGANDFSPLSGVAVQAVQGGTNFQIDSTLPGNRNGVLVDKDEAALTTAGVIATNLTANIIPNQGQDAIADASGLRIRLVAAAIDGNIVVEIPKDDALAARDEGSLVGTVLNAGGVEEVSGDAMTIVNAHDTAGDFFELLCDGAAAPKWYVSGAIQSANGAALTFA
jgi:hypothetical protein